MIVCLVLIEGKSVKEQDLNISLMNAKQLVVGNASFGFGIILHIAANSTDDLQNALLKFANVKNVTGIVIMMIRSLP